MADSGRLPVRGVVSTEMVVAQTRVSGSVPRGVEGFGHIFMPLFIAGVVIVGFDVTGVTRDGQAEPYVLEALSNGTRVKIGDKDVFRVDVFWFGYNNGDPVKDFYPRFWKALDGLDYRLHWGKFLPNPDQIAPSTLTSRYPKFEAWKAARRSADPKDVFLTKYWKDHLGI